MKRMKFLSLVLCGALIFALAGCTQQPAVTTPTTIPTTQETTLETTLATTTATATEYVDDSVAYHAPMSAISMPAVTAISEAANGTPLLTYTYQGLTLFLQEAAVADQIFLDYQNRLDGFHATARTLNTSAAGAYTGQDDWEPYSLQVQYQPIRFDETVLSFFATEVLYDGNSHGNTANFALTYDLLTGKALGIRDILVANYSADDLVALIVNGLAQYEADEVLFPDYAQLIADMFSTNRPVENWYFAPDGLCFFFNPYEIAPYSAGLIVSKVPYDALSGLLKDGYFPAEVVSFAGTPKIVKFRDANTENITTYAELILDTSGEEYLLCANGTMLNVRIEAISGESSCAVFAATAISKTDAVLIQCSDLSSLRLTYESQGQTVSVPLG